MDFITGLLSSANWKDNSYNLIIVIIDTLTKIVYYEPIKITIIILGLAEVIINVVILYHGFLELIVMD